MSDGYTPTTDGVRAAYIRSHRWPDGSRLRGHDDALAIEFDCWLAAHDREVAARALRDFRDRIYNGALDPYQAFYNEGLAPLLDAEAHRIEAGEVP